MGKTEKIIPMRGSKFWNWGLAYFAVLAIEIIVGKALFAAVPIMDPNHYLELAAGYCFICVALGKFISSHSFQSRFPVAAVLIQTTWRISSLAGIAVIASATKWPQYNLFCLTLVGCYFPFLALESCHSITTIAHLPRDQN